jgi:hypothetical protein
MSMPSNAAAFSPAGDCFACIDDPLVSGTGAANVIAQHFLGVCETELFLQHCAAMGFGSLRFQPNPFLDWEWSGYRKFASCYEEETARLAKTPPPPTEGESTIIPPRRLGLVFHGTSTDNILSILMNGLDASRRSGQSFGPGEYFSTTPSTCISYCRGGLQMPVFAVILPGQQSEVAPKDYVVVENNNHHLAIGTLNFGQVDRFVLTESEEKRQMFLRLDREAAAKLRIKECTEAKARIMALLIGNKIDLASEVYRRNSPAFDETTKREIAWYVVSKLDLAVVDYFFPNLPTPLSKAELAVAYVHNAEVAAREETQVLLELEVARKELATA